MVLSHNVDHGAQNVKQFYTDYHPYGLTLDIKMARPMPRVECKLHVRMVKVIRFSHAPKVICRGRMDAENLPLSLKLDII